MKHYDDITPALQSILMHFTRGYPLWVSFIAEAQKVNALGEKWAEAYGTRLPAWKRQDRKQKGLANAVAFSAPVLSHPGQRQVILMATEHALQMPEASVWRREKWETRLPEFSDFVIVHEPRERGDYAWTWRVQARTVGLLEKHLVAQIKAGNAYEVKRATEQWVRLYPMYGGVRRQVRRMMSGGAKLWTATMQSPWPGPDPKALPAMIGYRSTQRRR